MLVKMKEIWKDVAGYESIYQVSNLGRVKTKQRRSKPYRGSVGTSHLVKEKIRKPSVKNGYYFLWLYDGKGSRRMEYVHRLVGLNFLVDRDGPHVDHIDGDRKNNVVTNLRLTTQSLNLMNKPTRKGYHYKNGRYYARIRLNNVRMSLGGHGSESEAVQTYIAAKKKLLRVP